MSKKSALARKREAQEAERRRNRRLLAMAIGASVVIVVAVIATIVYFSVREDGYPAGLKVEDLVKGTGEKARSGDVLIVHYTLWLEDGTEVQSSVGGDPFQFTLGAGQVIKGWDAGLVGMKVGGARRLTIAPELGYGQQAKEGIPPGSTLIFEVELLAVQ